MDNMNECKRVCALCVCTWQYSYYPSIKTNWHNHYAVYFEGLGNCVKVWNNNFRLAVDMAESNDNYDQNLIKVGIGDKNLCENVCFTKLFTHTRITMNTKPFSFKACPSRYFTELYKESNAFAAKKQEVLNDFNSNDIYNQILNAARIGNDYLVEVKNCSSVDSADKLKVIMDDILSGDMKWLKCDIVYDFSGEKYFMQFTW